MASVVTAERYASGMTFDEYVAYIGTPENLAREGSGGSVRRDFSGFFREAFEKSRLSEAQSAALKWLAGAAGRPGEDARAVRGVVVGLPPRRADVRAIAADTGAWSCASSAATASSSPSARPALGRVADSNADIMAEFLNHKNGTTWQSIPVCVFYTRDLEYLYHYTEYPAIYEKDRITGEAAGRESRRVAGRGAGALRTEFPALQGV